MRIVRSGLVFAFLLSSTASAQASMDERTGFDNSWFWGAKGGVTSLNAGGGRISAPTIGGEWLITRNKGALYISGEQSFFDEVGGVFDQSVNGALRSVRVSDMRRYAIGLLAFPVTWGELRPYAGLGLSLNVIQSADPEGTYINQQTQTLVFQRVSEQTSKVSAVMTAGAQLQFGRTALFGQVSSMPTRSNFLLSGSNYTFVLEGGFRYNLANAIEALK
ncbi:MAG: hypothetical protein ACT4OZ_16190 [Gemmatimonadota bacterium]